MRADLKVGVFGAAAAIVLATGSTVAMAGASGAFNGGHPGSAHRIGTAQVAVCTAPALSGAVIDITLTDMGGHMGYGRGGMMTVRVSPTSSVAGTVSLRVTNAGRLTHELVVLPLARDARPGQRAVGADGTVEETGSLGEASNTCGADGGEGIVARAEGWTTLHLVPGRYELLCNLPGHYAAGMYAEVDVT
jgi:uncharacterized cupredoxin-like copper-binding protein